MPEAPPTDAGGDAPPALRKPRRLPRLAQGGGLVALAVVVAGVGWLFAPGRPAAAPPASDATTGQRPSRVAVADVRTGHVNRTDVLYGITSAPDRGRLAFTVAGRLAARPVEAGDRVAEGDLLARLDPRPFQNGLAAARATLAELQAREAQLARDQARVARLRDSGATSDQQAEQVDAELLALRAALDAARAQVAESQRLVGESVIRAPYPATVTASFVEPGEHAGPGQPVVELSGRAGVEVEAEAPESVAARLAPGDRVRVELPTRRLEIDGVVRAVSESGRGPGALFPVRVELLDDGEAVPGLTARLVLPDQGAKALLVPLRAVVDPTGRRPTVFRLGEDGRVQRTLIEADGLSGGQVIVRSGLEAGDRVVVEGQARLLDGDAVRIDEETLR
jgi:multidrug efflux system membrane fusion protein